MPENTADVRAARTRAIYLCKYLASGLLKLQFRYVPKERDPKMIAAVNKYGICFYGDIFLTYDIQERTVVLLHEVWHLLRNHPNLMLELTHCSGERVVFNLAADMAINQDLRSFMPDGDKVQLKPVYPETYEMPPNLTTEEYYRLLLEKLKKEGRLTPKTGGDGEAMLVELGDMAGPGQDLGKPLSGGCGSCAGEKRPGETDEKSNLSETEMEALRRYIAQEIQSSSRGTHPLGVERFAETTLTPVIPWQRVLHSNLMAKDNRIRGQTDYTYAVRSRRDAAMGRRVVLPGLTAYTPEVAAVIDSSGSMGQDEMETCVSEVKGILNTLNSHLYAYVVDAEIQWEGTVTKPSDVQLKGGGGTDMCVGIEAAAKRGCNICIVMTDGYTPWPEERPSFDVIGMITGERDSSYGYYTPPDWVTVIHVEDQKRG